jgi:hypothetical protein
MGTDIHKERIIVAQLKLLVPIPEAQIVLGDISRSHLYELIESREIKKVNIGRRSFVTTESIEAYVARLASAS